MLDVHNSSSFYYTFNRLFSSHLALISSFMRRFLFSIGCVLMGFSAFSQSVPNPPNPGVTNKFEPWGYTNTGSTHWHTFTYFSLFNNGLIMRVIPPNGVTYNRTKNTWTIPAGRKYPLMLFFHGNGEAGTDNNKQLVQGGQHQMIAIQNGTFDGFALYPQGVTYDQAKILVDWMLNNLQIDPNRVYVHGLSGGGGLAITFTIHYPTYIAAAFPMSATDVGMQSQSLLYTPWRESQGSKDINPYPATSQAVVDWYNANGGHLQYYLLDGVGHGTWDYMYALPDFFQWFLSYSKNTILVRYNRNLVCPGTPISVDMGFTPGFEAYEWSKEGVTIPGEINAKLIATAYGSYSGRIKNRGVWSDWATPVVVGPKPTTNTPPVQTNGVKSIVLPALDGSTTTELTLPAGYQSYAWKDASNTFVSTIQ